MKRIHLLRNAIAVGLTTLAIGGTVFASVTLAATTGTSDGANPRYGTALAQSSGGTLTCPRTGCTASSCHATQGGGRAGGQGYGAPSGGTAYGHGQQQNGEYETF